MAEWLAIDAAHIQNDGGFTHRRFADQSVQLRVQPLVLPRFRMQLRMQLLVLPGFRMQLNMQLLVLPGFRMQLKMQLLVLPGFRMQLKMQLIMQLLGVFAGVKVAFGVAF